MALIKAEFPILERDTEATAVIMPNPNGKFKAPKKAVFAFLGDTVAEYAEALGAEQIGSCETVSKTHPFYLLEYRGQQICLSEAPLGAAAAVSVLEELIAGGVEQIIATGTCGALVDFPENEFLIPVEALRDEGISYHYLPPSRSIATDSTLNDRMVETLTSKGLCCELVKTWTTDAFYRETPEMVAYRKEEGCQVVEMECSALAACASFRQVRFGQLLFTADTLADTSCYEERGFGRSAFSLALELALECCVAL